MTTPTPERLTSDISADLRSLASAYNAMELSEEDEGELLGEAADKLDGLITDLAAAENARDEARTAVARLEAQLAQARAEIEACRTEFAIVAETRQNLLALADEIAGGPAHQSLIANRIRLLLVRPIYTRGPWDESDLADALATPEVEHRHGMYRAADGIWIATVSGCVICEQTAARARNTHGAEYDPDTRTWTLHQRGCGECQEIRNGQMHIHDLVADGDAKPAAPAAAGADQGEAQGGEGRD